MYRAALRMAGYDVDIAGDGVTALVAIERDRPDLIVLDLELPQLRGDAILGELSAGSQRIPVIVVTGSSQDVPRGHDVVVLRKPCGPEHLVVVVERQLLQGGSAKAPA